MAVGKSTFAERLAEHLRGSTAAGAPVGVSVVSCDGFLFSNRELRERGLFERKGEPSTFDLDALRRFLIAAREGGPREGAESLSVPVYSHVDYDVRADPELLGDADVIIVEGVVALQDPVRDMLDIGIYLDADPDLLRSWFVDRLLAMVDALPPESSSVLSFFRQFEGDARRSAAIVTWDSLNLPNNLRYIRPTRATADLIVTKGGDHRILEVERRARSTE